jgi:hypothetical protein
VCELAPGGAASRRAAAWRRHAGVAANGISPLKSVADADVLRNPDDPRMAIVFRSPVKVDEFVLKFEDSR